MTVRDPSGDPPRSAGATEPAQRMLGAAPGIPALGRGPANDDEFSQHDYHHPAAGWGAAVSVAQVVARTHEPVDAPRAIFRMNHENGGFDCPGCAWPDDRKGLRMDICENGIKHVTWEMTAKRTDREFFAAHTVSELSGWTDFALEDQGRLTEPMVYDPASDKYVPISWPDAFELVGSTLRGLASPDQATFYTSGRLSNEGSFLYQLWVREYGTNNLPDCSNMCHQASGLALNAALGTGKGTVDLKDWDEADAIFVIGANAASNAPRMLTSLANAYKRGAQLVHINPLVESAATSTIVPHQLLAMATFRATKIGTMNVQPRIGGDLALLRGIAKAVLEAAQADSTAVDREFIDRYTAGFEDYRRLCAETPWSELEQQSGVAETQIRQVADVYLRSNRTIISWCLGITQQEHGVDTVREIVNVLLLRGNLGREGAGPCPIRGHSNVQGNRTCGIDQTVPRSPGGGMRHRSAAPGRAGRRPDDRGHASRRREGIRRPRRQLRPCHARHGLQQSGPAELRPDRAREHEAQSQPHRARPAGTDPALPWTHREGSPARWRAGRDGRGQHGDGPHVGRHEGAGIPASPVGTGDHRRHGQGDAAQHAHSVAGLRRRLRPHPRHDGPSPRRVRGLQSSRPTAAGVSNSPARPGTGVLDRICSRRVFHGSDA
jgi:hypothetical protein